MTNGDRVALTFDVVVPAYGVDPSEAVESARPDATEVVIVDDGSEPPIEAAAPVLRTPHRGVAHARNAGAAAGRGDVIVFLDADDVLLPGWRETFASSFHSDAVVCVCAPVELTDSSGGTQVTRPGPLGPAFAGFDGLFLAGSFAVRRAVFHAVGGYDQRLAYAENSELGLRIASWCERTGDRIAVAARPVVRVHRRDAHGRREQYAGDRIRAVEHIFAVHRARLDLDRRMEADYSRVAGASAAHLGDFRTARRWFVRSLRKRWHLPTFGRAALTVLPVIRRRAWQVP